MPCGYSPCSTNTMADTIAAYFYRPAIKIHIDPLTMPFSWMLSVLCREIVPADTDAEWATDSALGSLLFATHNLSATSLTLIASDSDICSSSVEPRSSRLSPLPVGYRRHQPARRSPPQPSLRQDRSPRPAHLHSATRSRRGRYGPWGQT